MVRIPLGTLSLGVGWGRSSGSTWAVVGNDQSGIVDFLKLPHVPYEQQIELLNAWLAQERTETRDDGSKVKFTYE